MAEVAVEKNICEVCGAEIRPGALFCYGCGIAVPGSKDDAVTAAPTESKNVTPPVADDPAENVAANGDKYLNGSGGEKLQPASALRRKKRAIERKPVEVVWKEPESASTRFIFASVILTAVVLGLLIAAYYLR